MKPLAEELICLAYTSAATREVGMDEVMQILSASLRRNPAMGITGMLLVSEGSFFQVLEGKRHDVIQLYMRISADDRHDKIVKVLERPIERCAFADWSMGWAELTRAELRSIPGCNDFFAGGRCLSAIDEGIALKLLEAFKEGKWRRRLK
jgi:hypothetical protein